MKKIFILITILSLTYCCSEQKLDTFKGYDTIYFNSTANTVLSNSASYPDSVMCSLSETNSTDTIFQVRVRAMGEIKDYDRPFRVKIINGTADENVHYTPLEDEYMIPAGEIFGYVPLHIYRHETMYDSIYYVELKLLDNEYFSTDIYIKDEVTPSNIRVFMTSTILMPAGWRETDAYVGYFSPAKYFLTLEVMEQEPSFWNTVNANKLFGTRTVMGNYLNEKIALGPYEAIKDPHPKATKGFMTFPGVVIPEEWEHADYYVK